jgi:hypothetical protein
MCRPSGPLMSQTFAQSARDGRLAEVITRSTPTPVMCVNAWPATQGRRSFFFTQRNFFSNCEKRCGAFSKGENAARYDTGCSGATAASRNRGPVSGRHEVAETPRSHGGEAAEGVREVTLIDESNSAGNLANRQV